MSRLRFARVDGPHGPLWVAETDRGVAAATHAEAPDAMLAELGRRFPGVEPEADDVDARWLTDGRAPELDTTGLSAFDVRVYDVVRRVPAGDTMTYGDVVGSPGAARAVGGAMSRCPFFPAVPCHRVVRASDGWSGWGGDDRLKRRLLDREMR